MINTPWLVVPESCMVVVVLVAPAGDTVTVPPEAIVPMVPKFMACDWLVLIAVRIKAVAFPEMVKAYTDVHVSIAIAVIRNMNIGIFLMLSSLLFIICRI